MATPTKPFSSAADRTAFVAPYLRAWNEHDVDTVLTFLAEDVVWAHPGLAEPVRGKAAVRKDLEELFGAFPDLHLPAEDNEIFTSRDPSRVIVLWTHHATLRGVLAPGYAPTGKTVRSRGVCLYRLRDGLITEHTIIFDGFDYLQQLGLLPREGQLGLRIMRGAHNLGARVKGMLRRWLHR